MKRIGIIGDIHAEDVRLEAALRFLTDAEADLLLAVGDIVDGAGDADRTCALLVRHGVLAVRGNHDRWFLRREMRSLPDITRALGDEARAFLSALPVTRELDTPAGKLLLCHGVGEDDMARLTPDDYGYALQTNDALHDVLAKGYAIVVGGHTHRRMVRHIESTVFINAGTLHREHEPGFGVVDLERREVQYYDLVDAVVAAGVHSF
jgi:putative phosphoesterase